MKNPPSYCDSGVAASSRISATLEKRGPRSSTARNCACCSGVPMANTSTRPSRRFLTKPLMHSSSAAACVKKRKPTPCTIPATKYRLACFASLTNRQNCSRELALLPRPGPPGCDSRVARSPCVTLMVRQVAVDCPAAQCTHPIYYESCEPILGLPKFPHPSSCGCSSGHDSLARVPASCARNTPRSPCTSTGAPRHSHRE